MCTFLLLNKVALGKHVYVTRFRFSMRCFQTEMFTYISFKLGKCTLKVNVEPLRVKTNLVLVCTYNWTLTFGHSYTIMRKLQHQNNYFLFVNFTRQIQHAMKTAVTDDTWCILLLIKKIKKNRWANYLTYISGYFTYYYISKQHHCNEYKINCCSKQILMLKIVSAKIYLLCSVHIIYPSQRIV